MIIVISAIFSRTEYCSDIADPEEPSGTFPCSKQVLNLSFEGLSLMVIGYLDGKAWYLGGSGLVTQGLVSLDTR